MIMVLCEPDRPHDPSRTWVWNYTPALRCIRKVLKLVDIIQIRHLMEEHFSDAMTMTVTRCLTLPDLRDPGEVAMFTYSRLRNPSQLQTTTVGELLGHQSIYLQHLGGSSSTPMKWIFDGVILLATSLLYEILTPSVAYYKKTAQTGPRHKK